jgi:hyperosmotically inducible protein
MPGVRTTDLKPPQTPNRSLLTPLPNMLTPVSARRIVSPSKNLSRTEFAMPVSSCITHRLVPVLAVVLASTLSTGIIAAQNPAPETGTGWSQPDTLRVVKEVQKRLGNLTNYAVFDWITFGLHDKTVVLKGYASRPILKTEAGNVIKGIPGVEAVDNQIEVLPTSFMDDRIRGAVYNRIYTQPALRRYNANQGTNRQAIGPGPSIARMAGGITADPPQGYNAIHIIVKNGNVALYGIVDRESDAAIADMQAKSTPGVFSVDNFLIVPQRPAKTDKKK